ncbi:MAG: hypothetical protein HY757_08630 [Nitrospirae bacterium]|nr:hypothetical protein [Nitrospirota bacterium]
MDTKRILNVFIASPGDMVVERKIVSEVCLGLNESTLMNHIGISFNTSEWKYIFPFTEKILDRLIDDCDILVFIFYKRDVICSGRTESEALNKFLSVYDSLKSFKKPHFIIFLKDEKVSDGEELKDPQFNSIVNLREKTGNDKMLSFGEFSSPYEFCEKIYDYLEKWSIENVKKN